MSDKLTDLSITDEIVEAAELAMQFDAEKGATYWELAHAALAAAVPLLRKAWEQELGVPWIEYSLVRDSDGHRYTGYASDCRAPHCDCYLATHPEPIVGEEHVESRKVYRTPWAATSEAS